MKAHEIGVYVYVGDRKKKGKEGRGQSPDGDHYAGEWMDGKHMDCLHALNMETLSNNVKRRDKILESSKIVNIQVMENVYIVVV